MSYAQDLIKRLLTENPQLHVFSENVAKEVVEYTGIDVKEGPTSFAVGPFVIEYFAETVKDEHFTIETGGGHTTIALAALSKHHICVTPDTVSIEQISKYMDQLGIPRDKVTFLAEPSEIALPKIMGITRVSTLEATYEIPKTILPDKLDFAFIDGNHAYPIPAIDWHFIDLNMKVGGIVGFDNAEIPAVNEVCEYLEKNKTYEWLKTLFFPPETKYNYCAKFYRKLKDEVNPRSATVQLYNHRRVTRNTFLDSLRTTFQLGRKPWPWS